MIERTSSESHDKTEFDPNKLLRKNTSASLLDLSRKITPPKLNTDEETSILKVEKTLRGSVLFYLDTKFEPNGKDGKKYSEQKYVPISDSSQVRINNTVVGKPIDNGMDGWSNTTKYTTFRRPLSFDKQWFYTKRLKHHCYKKCCCFCCFIQKKKKKTNIDKPNDNLMQAQSETDTLASVKEIETTNRITPYKSILKNKDDYIPIINEDYINPLESDDT